MKIEINKIYQVNYKALNSSGTDTVVCPNESDIKGILEERGYKNPEISSIKEISPQKIRVRDITVGDLLKLINSIPMLD